MQWQSCQFYDFQADFPKKHEKGHEKMGLPFASLRRRNLWFSSDRYRAFLKWSPFKWLPKTMKEKVYLFVIFIAIEIVSACHLRYIFISEGSTWMSLSLFTNAQLFSFQIVEGTKPSKRKQKEKKGIWGQAKGATTTNSFPALWSAAFLWYCTRIKSHTLVVVFKDRLQKVIFCLNRRMCPFFKVCMFKAHECTRARETHADSLEIIRPDTIPSQ